MCQCHKGKCQWCGVKYDRLNGHSCTGTELKNELNEILRKYETNKN